MNVKQISTCIKLFIVISTCVTGISLSYASNAVYVTTFAGNGSTSSLDFPEDMVQDASGNFYVADWNKHKILKITPEGVVSTFAGTGLAGYLNHTTATSAQFRNPAGITMDASGNLYVADNSNNCIRKIVVTNGAAGAVSTFAGTGTSGYKNGLSSTAQFSAPVNIRMYNNYFYVADFGNHAIRQIAPDGNVTTLSGGIGAGITDGAATIAKHNGPYRLTINKQGVMYVVNVFAGTVRQISFTQGTTSTNVNVTTVGGLGNVLGYADAATGSNARFNYPHGITVDDTGNLYIADLINNRIRMINTQGVVSTLAGSTAGSTTNTIGALATFNQPAQCYFAPDGNIYIGERSNHMIRKLSFKPNYAVQTVTTKGNSFNRHHDIAQDSKGNYFVANRDSHQILKITSDGTATVFVGSGSAGFLDHTDGKQAKFNNPCSVVCDSADNIYVTDLANNRIRKVTPDGEVTTFAGSGNSAVTNAIGKEAAFNYPYYIRIDQAGNFYVSEWDGHVIRKIAPNGMVTTLAGTANSPGYMNGAGAVAKFKNPSGLHVDNIGNVYVADVSNKVIRKITPDGIVTTISGNNESSGNVDGMPSVAKFIDPHGITGDINGNLFVTDQNYIRIITPDGYTRTIAGTRAAGRVDAIFGLSSQLNGTASLITDKTKGLITIERNSGSIRLLSIFPGYMW